jgi:Ca2+-binding RTX toxin-like protein
MHFPTSRVGLPKACKATLVGAVLGLALAPVPVLPQDAGGGVAASDIDGDGVSGRSDNCPTVANPGQADTFGILGVGDACEAPPNPDSDQDGIANIRDNCPAHFNPKQTDSDQDSQGDACDTQLIAQSHVSCLGQATTIDGTSNSETINGTAGNDVIAGLNGNDTINGRGGSDRLCGGGQADRLRGNAGNDRLNGNSGNDDMFGAGGSDTLNGVDGVAHDILDGGENFDRCFIDLVRHRTEEDTVGRCEEVIRRDAASSG